MTRTLFVGEPTPRDLEVYELVARRPGGGHRRARGGRGRRRTAPDGRSDRRASRAGSSRPPGTASTSATALGHGIGLATHEAPSLGRTAAETSLPSPTVFSVEPGVYLDGETGVRIEDLVHFDVDARTVERLTRVPTRGHRRRGLTSADGIGTCSRRCRSTLGFFGAIIVLTLAVPLVTTVLIVGTIVWAIRGRVPPSEDPAVAELKARFARGEIDTAEYQVRLETLEGDD